MFTEFVKISIIIDSGAAAKADAALNTRFTKVAHKFGKGLSSVIKLSFFGLSVALLQKLLNPIKEVEDRIKALLQTTGDVTDVAARLNTSKGRVEQLQQLGHVNGLSNDAVKDLLMKFAEGVEKARDEYKVRDKFPSAEISPEAQVLKNYRNEKDLGTSFTRFMQGLQTAKPEDRRIAEKLVFGGEQYGAARKFLNIGNVDKSSSMLKLSSLDEKTKALAKLEYMNQLHRIGETQNEDFNTIDSAKRLTPEIINQLNAREAEQLAKARTQNAESLLRAANGIDFLLEKTQPITDMATKILGNWGYILNGGSQNRNLRKDTSPTGK